MEQIVAQDACTSWLQRLASTKRQFVIRRERLLKLPDSEPVIKMWDGFLSAGRQVRTQVCLIRLPGST